MKNDFSARGNITLFLITLAFTVLAGFICHMFGADRVTTIACSPMGGIVSLMAVGALLEYGKVTTDTPPDWGVIGIVAGTAVSLLLF